MDEEINTLGERVQQFKTLINLGKHFFYNISKGTYFGNYQTL